MIFCISGVIDAETLRRQVKINEPEERIEEEIEDEPIYADVIYEETGKGNIEMKLLKPVISDPTVCKIVLCLIFERGQLQAQRFL